MDKNDIETVVWVYIFLCISVSVAVSFWLQARLERSNPDTRPFRWGFYNGCMSICCFPIGLLCSAMVLTAIRRGDAYNVGYFGVWSAWMLGDAVCGYFVIHRRKWAWLASTFLSANLFVWIINAIYGKNRWDELT